MPHADILPAAPLSRSPTARAGSDGARLLQRAAALWLAVALAGQLLMALYVIGFYGRAWLAGTPERWNDVLSTGHVAGDTLGNAVLLGHLAFAVLIILGGAVQLLPPLRRRWPALHRWNGRLYLLAATVLALGGLYMTWGRGASGTPALDLGVSSNALAILACVVLALHHARARRLDAHRRWALRLFLVVSGVWFFRVGLFIWLLLVGPVGIDFASFSGPTLSALAFLQWLLPLAVLELVLRVQRQGSAVARRATAGLLFACSALTALGIAGAAMGLWLPRL